MDEKTIAGIRWVVRVLSDHKGISMDPRICEAVASKLEALLPREETLEDLAEAMIEQFDHVGFCNLHNLQSRLRAALERRKAGK